MKFFIILFTAFSMFGCNRPNNKIYQLQTKVDSLQKQLDESYRPGLGEFMLNIQVHHAKLWFAGQNQNWELADFEIHEIQEALEDIQHFNADRPEVKSIAMINPPLDTLNNAIQQKNPELFKTSFSVLTNTCNSCHKTTNHAFNVVTIPNAPPVTNQDFKPLNK